MVYYWDDYAILLVRLWHAIGITMARYWDDYGMILGCFWHVSKMFYRYFGMMFAMFRETIFFCPKPA